MIHSSRAAIILMALLSLSISCRDNNSSTVGTGIDYSTLADIPITLELEIGETEEFIPGEIDQVFADSDGDIIVTDRQSSIAIDQFDKEGNYEGRIAKEGRGPGELQRFYQFANLGDGSFMVFMFPNSMLFYSKNENGLYSFKESFMPEIPPKRRLSISSKFQDGEYFANNIMVMDGRPDANEYNKDNFRTAYLSIIDKESNVVKDSVLSLKNPVSHMTLIERGFRFDDIPFQWTDKFHSFGDGTYLIARPDSSTITLYDRDHSISKIIEFKVTPRAVTPSDLEYELGDTDQPIRSEIENRVTEFKPPYLSMWATKQHILFLTNESAEGKDFAVVDYDGNTLGKITLSELDEVKYFTDNTIYTVHNSPETGDSIRKYTIKI